ncbi:MAG: metallophosphoesterase family protein [Acidobacteria bacterium]|nr:metallophosphoesterase family protein [Acidobacteriota bacterium]
MKIGVISDTHGYFDPRLPELFSGVDAILHAGDVGSGKVLDQLAQNAKVYAVRGNIDSPALELPPSLKTSFEGVQVEVIHQLSLPQSELEVWSDGEMLGKMQPERREAFLQGFDEPTRVVVFGHSHQPCLLTVGHRLFFNPGSAGQQRFSLPRCCGLLEVFPRGVRGTMMSLERLGEKLPGRVWLPVAEEAP